MNKSTAFTLIHLRPQTKFTTSSFSVCSSSHNKLPLCFITLIHFKQFALFPSHASNMGINFCFFFVRVFLCLFSERCY